MPSILLLKPCKPSSGSRNPLVRLCIRSDFEDWVISGSTAQPHESEPKKTSVTRSFGLHVGIICRNSFRLIVLWAQRKGQQEAPSVSIGAKLNTEDRRLLSEWVF